jgi:hypothetical protein
MNLLVNKGEIPGTFSGKDGLRAALIGSDVSFGAFAGEERFGAALIGNGVSLGAFADRCRPLPARRRRNVN